MAVAPPLQEASPQEGYLFGRGPAWFAFAMTLALMTFDYVDRQIIVSLFPYLKAEWALTDKQLGALASVVSVTVAIGAVPIALFADRVSRVKSIAAMAAIWSLATLSCGMARNYGMLLAARGAIGLGEAGYGSVGSALIASHFPSRLRSSVMASFFASSAVGSVVGVMLGGLIAARWGWQAAFGIVGLPGLVLALLYLKVRDYRTVALAPAAGAAAGTQAGPLRHVVHMLTHTRTLLWVCIGGPAQLIVVSALWAWLPSYLNRLHGVAPAQAGMQAALVVLAGAAGGVIWGAVIDRAGGQQPRRKLATLALLCIASGIVLASAFAFTFEPRTQFALTLFGGFLATCTSGPATAIVIDVIHPGVRATGCAVFALVQNLFGLAVGPFLAGVLSDAWGLVPALTITPVFSLLAATAFLLAGRSYEAEKARTTAAIALEAEGRLRVGLA
ncbi:MAG: MFS transporter [Burkholderiales bacterium]|nr:MFS transporter [Burkholderiales bacterium]